MPESGASGILAIAAIKVSDVNFSKRVSSALRCGISDLCQKRECGLSVRISKALRSNDACVISGETGTDDVEDVST
jgi:hypothetical protein